MLHIEYVKKRRAWDTCRSQIIVHIIFAHLPMSIYNIEGQICVNCNFCLHQSHTCSQKLSSFFVLTLLDQGMQLNTFLYILYVDFRRK